MALHFQLVLVIRDALQDMKTIGRRIEYEIAKRKGSRFIAAAWPITVDHDDHDQTDATSNTPMQVRELLAHQHAKFPSACHHCFAYTTHDGREQCSDDGEPHHTAGKPILVALQRAELVDVCLVVSRIFGGTKLGTGGLIRAYGAAAQECLQQAEIIERVPTKMLHLRTSFAYIDVIKHGCGKFLGEIVAQQFQDSAEFTIRVPKVHADDLWGFLQSKSSGNILHIRERQNT